MRRIPSLICAGSIAAFLAASAVLRTPGRAAMVYWDTNSVTAGAGGTAPSGSWASSFWNSVAGGTGSTSAWTAGDIAVFSAGTDATGAYTVTISGTQSIGGLVFEDGTVTLTSGTLSLATASDFQVLSGQAARIDSVLSGSAALRKTGFGSLRLGANNYSAFTGSLTISSGVLSVTSLDALGSGVGTITVEGTATRAQGGGLLALGGTYAAGLALTRPLLVTGGGPGGDGPALLSVGNNSISSITTGATSATRLYAAGGTTTVTSLTGGAGQNTQLNGPGHWVLSGVTISGQTNSLFQKAGAGGAILTGTNFIDNEVRVSGGSLRVASGTGLPILSTDSGVLEVRTDAAASFVDTRMILRAQNTTNAIFLDRAVGSTAGLLNQTVVFSDSSFANNNTTHAFVSRNGYGLTLSGAGSDFGNIPFATGNPIAITNSLSGLLTFAGNLAFSDGTNRTYTLQGNAETTVTGNVTSTGAIHTLTKGGTGTLTIAGTASTYRGGTNVNAGTLAANQLTGIGNNVINLGSTTTAARFEYLGATGTGAGESSARVFNLAGTTGAGMLMANQAGSAPSALTLTANVASSVAGAKTLFLGGTSGLDNTMSGVIQDNSLANKTTLTKNGPGTWIYSPAVASYSAGAPTTNSADAASGTNTITVGSTTGVVLGQAISGTNVPAGAVVTGINGSVITISSTIGTTITSGTALTFGAVSGFTGGVTVTGGTLKIQPTATSGNGSNVIENANGLTFTFDGMASNGFAGGTFDYVGVNDSASTETLGALNAAAGASTVKITPTGGLGTAELTFTSLLSPSAGTGLNFSVPAGGSAKITGTSAFVNAGAYFNGADFAYSGASTVLRAPVYGTDAGFVTSASALTASAHNQITGSFSAGTATINSLKIAGSQMLTLTGVLTVQTAANARGGILAAGGTSSIGGIGTLTTNGSGDLVVRVDGGSDQLTIAATIVSSTTGGLTKNGAGKLILSGGNLYTGTSTINEGTLQLNTGGRLGGPTPTTSVNGLTVRQAGTLELNGVSLTVGSFNGAGSVTNSSGTAATLTIGNGGGVGVFSGVVSGNLGITKTGAGLTMSLTGANTYTGATQITGGTLVANSLANGGAASSIGMSGNAAGNLVFNAGTLLYTGSTAQIYRTTQTPSASTDRLFTLAGAATIDSSGTFGNSVLAAGTANHATLLFTNTGDVAFSGAVGTRSLTLTGTSTGDNELRPRLTDYSGSALSVTKTSTGMWILNPAVANTYTGATTISGGILQAQHGVGLPTGSLLTINGGVFQSSGSFTRTLGAAAGNVQITGGASGFGASSSKLTITLGGGGLTWGAATFNPSTLVLSSTTALSEVELTNAINLGTSVRTVQVDDNPGTALDFAVLSGVLSGSTGGVLTKTGGGALFLTNPGNTYTDNTAINGGTLVAGVIGNSGSASSNVGAGASRVLINNATFTYVGAGETTNRAVVMAGTTGGATIDASGAGPLVLTNVVTTTAGGAGSGAKTLTLTGSSSDANEIRSNIINNEGGNIALTKSGGGIWILSGANTYSGATSLSGNGAIGIASGTPFGTSAVTITNASIFAVGQDRTFNNNVLFAGNATEGVYGDYSLTLTGLVTFGNNSNNTTLSNFLVPGKLLTLSGTVRNQDGGTARTLIINGTGDMLINGPVTNNGAVASNLQWSSSGLLRLTDGSNSYTGPTTITAGALQATDGSSLPVTTVLTLNGGVFQTNGTFSRTLGTAAGNVRWAGSGGFSAADGALTLDLNPAGTLVWGSTPEFITGTNSLVFGSISADSEVNWVDDLDFNNTTGGVTRTIVVNDNPASSTDRARISGSLTKSSTGTVGIAKNGAGTLVIDKVTADNSNAFDGTLTINAGTFLLLGTPQNGGALTMAPSATGTNLVLGANVTFLRPGTFTAAAASATSGIAITPETPGNGSEIRLHNAATRVTRTYLINDNPLVLDDVTIAVPLVNGPGTGEVNFSKEGAGRLVLSADNAWLGTTILYKGTTVIDYTTSAVEKLANAADLEPRGGVLILKGSNTAPVNETVGNLSPGSSNLGIQGTNPSPLYVNPASIGSLTGTTAPNGGQSLIELQPSASQPLTLTFTGFIRNPGGGIVLLSTTDALNGTFRTTQTGDLNNGRMLASNVLLDGRWIAQDGLGKILQHFGAVQSDPSQWQSNQSVELNGPVTGAGVLGTSRVAGLIFAGTNTALSINNDARSLTLSNAAILVTPEATASVIEINDGKLLTELPYKSAPGADLLIENFSSARLKISSNLGHSDAPQGNTELITIAGTGIVELAGESTSMLTYAGATLLRGAVKVIGGATLRVSGGDAISDYLPIDLGTAGDVGGTFQLDGATETIGGLLGVNVNQGVSSGVIDLGSGGVLTLNQTLANTYSGPLNGTGTLIKQGNAALTSNGSELAFGGTLEITGGILNLTGNLTHGLSGAVTSVLLAGGEIFGEHNAGGLAAINKLPDTATFTLVGTRGFGLQISSNTSGRSDAIQAIVVGPGANVVTVNAANNTSQLTLNATQATDALTRTTDRGTLVVRGDNLGGGLGGSLNNSARILLGSGATGLGLIGGGGATPFNYSILPWAIGTTGDGGAAAAVGDSFVTYGPNGLRPLSTTSEYTTSYAAAAATDNFSTNTTQAGLAAKTINSLRIDTSAGAVTLSGSGVLTLNSGALLVSAAGTTNTATIDGFARLDPGATNEFVFHVTSSNATPSGAVLELNSALNEAGGGTAVTKSGNGTLRLGTTNSFAGGLTVNQGVVEFSDVLATSLGNSAGAIRLAGGTLKYSGSSPVNITTHPIVLSGPSSFYTPTGTGAGGNALNRGSSIDTGTQNMTIAGPTGNGGLVKIGTSDLIVSTAATYTGSTVVMQGRAFFNDTLSGSSGLFLIPENIGGVDNTISATVTNALSVNQLIVGGVFTSASSLSGTATLTVGDATHHPVVTIGNGGGDSFLLVGYHDEGAANGAANTTTKGTLNLINAGSVNINVSRLFVGQNKGAGSGRTDGDVLLSTGPTSTGNNVTAGYVVVGHSPGPDSTGGGGIVSNLVLGNGLNNFNVDSLIVGGLNSNGKIVLNAGGNFRLRDRAGVGGADVYIGDNDDITNTLQDANSTTLDTTSGSIDARINLLVIGRHAGNTSGTATTGGGGGALRFKNGEINAAEVELAMVGTRGIFTQTAVSTLAEITQDGGTFRFGTMTRGLGTVQYNWNEGTIEPLPGSNAVNNNVFITTKPNVNGDNHFVSVPIGRTMTFETAAGFDGSGSIFKTGAGTLVLKGDSTYGGGTEVRAGTLLANNISGSATGVGLVTVQNSAELGGSGSVVGPAVIESGGKLSVGATPGELGTFTIDGDLAMDPGGILQLEIETNNLTPLSDLLTVNGSLDLDLDGDPSTNATLSITDLDRAILTEGTTITLITYFGGWDGGLFRFGGTVIDDYDPDFNDTSTIFYIGGYGFRLDYNAGFSGNSVDLISVPEPGALASLIGGIGMLLGLQRFRRWSAKG